MSLGSKITEIGQAVNNLVMAGVKSKTTERIVGGAARGLNKTLDIAAGAANKGLETGKAVTKKLSNPVTRQAIKSNIKNGVGNAIRNTITDEDAYKAVKLGKKDSVLKMKVNKNETPVAVANKFLVGDEIHKRVKTGIDSAAHVLGGESWLTLKQPLVKGGGDNLLPFGMQATGMGVAVAGVAQMAMGTPQAVEQWNRGRMGTNYNNQPVTSAPRTPAYANNGGATGDLVFALNNLRNGGMM